MLNWGIPRGLVVKNPPAMQELQEMRVLSLGQEDFLEGDTATHSGILAWRIPWTGAWWAKVHGIEENRTCLSN